MTAKKFTYLINYLGVVFLLLFAFSVSASAKDCCVYRLYSPVNNEHLYTTDYVEVCSLVNNQNWTDEGVGWSTTDTGDPVYRLYSPQLHEHLYTTDQNEVNDLTTRSGWTKDNNGQPLFNSSGTIPVYRLYKGSLGRHHLTLDENECNVITGQGWNQEGVAFYASATGNSTPVSSHNAATCPYGIYCPEHHDSTHCPYGENCPTHHDSSHCIYGSNCPGHHNGTPTSGTTGGTHHSESHHNGAHH